MAITKEQARAELARRELARRESSKETVSDKKQPTALEQRPSAMADLIQNPTTMKHPLGALLRTMGGASELYQGIPASIALDLQAGRPQDIMGNLGKVVTGQRPAQYGDVFRGAGVDEFSSATGGLITDLALAPGGKQAMEGAAKLVGGGVKALKGILKWDSAYKQAVKSQEALQTVRNTLGKAKELAIQEVKDVPAELSFKGNQSQKIIDAIKNPIYEVEFTAQGGVKETVGNLDKVKEAVGDLLTPKNWQEAPKKEMAMIKKFYGNTVESMKVSAKKAGKPIDDVLGKYEDFMDNYRLVKSTIQESGGKAISNKLKTTFDFVSERAYKEAWKEVAKYSPEVKSVMNSMQHRSLLKDLLKVSVGTGLATGAVGGTSYLVNR